MNVSAVKPVLGLLALLVILDPRSLRAQGLEDDGLSDENRIGLEFARRLSSNGMNDYAKRVTDRLTGLPPNILDVMETKNLCAVKKFDEVKAIIARQTDPNSESTWILKCTLADGYYAWGKYPEAQGIYESFFKKYPDTPPENIRAFFRRSAYKYAQMLINMGANERAINAYKQAAKTIDPKTLDKAEKSTLRQLQGERAELMLTVADADPDKRATYFPQIKKLAGDLMWVQDLWFGKSIVMLAHIHKLSGEPDKAIALVEKYTSQLKDYDKILKEASTEGEDFMKLSPMAQCRYMLGTIQLEAAQALIAAGDMDGAYLRLVGTETQLRGGKTKRKGGALQHLLNVFIRYSSTPWAPLAGKKAREVESILKEKYGKEVKTGITDEQWAKVEKAQFREAHVFFNQNNFEKAAAAYIEVLNLFPERPASVRALSSLATCFIELEDELMIDTTVRYLAERFAYHPEQMLVAGDSVLRLAYAFNEKGMPLKEQFCYDTFFTHFRKHPRTPGELYRFGDKEYGTENYEGAKAYYDQIVEDHAGTPQYYRALSKTAYVYSKQGEHSDEIKVLNRLIKELKTKESPGHELASAMFRFATALNSMGRSEKKPALTEMAVKRYSELEKMLLDPEQRADYENSAEEAEANLAVLQGAMFYRAMADVTRKSVLPKVQAAYDKKYKRKVPPALILKVYKKNAIKTLTKLVDTFPESKFAPSALSQIATIHTVLGGEEAIKSASEVLKRLEREYPKSPEAENATYMIAKTLLDMGMKRQAVAKFREMFSGSGEFPATQILVAARELFKAEEYDLALEGFERVLKDAPDSRPLAEPSRVGKAKCLAEKGKDMEAVALLESVLEDYPRSGYTVEICEFLSKSYAQLAKELSVFEERKVAFNKAIAAVNRAKRFVSGQPGPKARLSVAAANLLAVKAAAEEEHGEPERAKDFRGQSISAYQVMIMSTPPFDAETRPHVERAYAECLPLMLVDGHNDAVLESGSEYLEQYPRGRYLSEVRRAMTRARVAGGSANSDEDLPTTDDEATTTEPATAESPEE